ncbi:MAG: bacillithiol biosynthesis cysteine-adding enzyme BshC [Candidatus Eremiobacteraeota bacterium]|nr:bacillithiol biosynthesis cysteine-adding enzyme BshC [Candidatus Eremiobacteraeota bacterium]
MESTVPFNAVVGDNRLFCDYVEHYERLSPFFRGDPREESSFQAVIREVAEKDYRRPELCEILLAQNTRWGAGAPTREKIAALGDSRCFAVLTGQQLGLFGGPLYTIYKAVTALRLASSLSETFSAPSIALFWIESDDHDFSETASFRAVRGREVQQIAYEPSPQGGKLPLSLHVLDGQIRKPLEELDAFLPETAFKGALLEELSRCFSPGKPYVDAFGEWLLSLLGGYGLVLVSPSDRRLKELAAPLFARELATAPQSSRLITGAGERLRSLGYHAQIGSAAGKVNLFHHTPGREAIRSIDGQFTLERQGERSPAELEATLARSPDSFSPGVALRPLMEDLLFPTVAYVGGPGEVAYWAQVLSLYDMFGITKPLVFPRMSLTLVEGGIRRVIDKYGLRAGGLFPTRGESLAEALAPHFPGDLRGKMEEGLGELEAVIRRLEGEAVAADENLRPAFRHFSGKVKGLGEALAGKVRDAVTRKDGVLQDHMEKTRASMFPGGFLQERSLNVVQFVARYGSGFIDRLFREPAVLPPWNHQIMEL